MKYLSLISLILVASATAFGGNILINGDFETLTNPVGNQTYNTLNPGSNELPGWTVISPNGSGGNVGLVMGSSGDPYDSYAEIGNYNDVAAFQSESGNYNVDLTGPGNTLYGGIAQTVSTTAGQQYQLSFWVGKMSDSYMYGGQAIYGGPSTVDVQIGGTDYGAFSNDVSLPSAGTDSYTGGPLFFMSWEESTVDFTGTGGNMNIEFLNDTPATNSVAGLDNVDLEEISSTPEPRSVLLFAAGLASLAVVRRQAAC